jgi:glyoxylase-like metal-dependent hydrolase (beta-lactamase superfamily II)
LGKRINDNEITSGAKVKLGDLEFHIVSDGHIYLDGGAMFGIVPKPLWEKKIPADARNRIKLGLNCLLVYAGGKRILIETGAGGKMDAKQRDIFGLDGPRLSDQLREYAIAPGDIDIVVNTHLHFDHCGGNTRLEKDKVVATFPNARYVSRKGEYEMAMHTNERTRATYFPENYAALEATNQLELIERDTEIAPGVELICVPGHTADMLCIKLSGGGKSAFCLADLVPTAAHLPLAWTMGFDLFPLTVVENKRKWLAQIAREEWIALFVHDSAEPAVYLRQRGEKYETEPVKID